MKYRDGDQMEQPAALLEEWMAEHGPAVLGLARKMLRDSHAAEDVFQTTFVKAYCRTLPFRDAGHARAWLLTVAANDCRSRLRSAWKKKVSLTCTLPNARQNGPAAAGLAEALGKLPPRYRDLVWLYYYAGYDTNEIARMAGIPPATVRTRLKRARERLKGLLDRSECFEEP